MSDKNQKNVPTVYVDEFPIKKVRVNVRKIVPEHERQIIGLSVRMRGLENRVDILEKEKKK